MHKIAIRQMLGYRIYRALAGVVCKESSLLHLVIVCSEGRSIREFQ